MKIEISECGSLMLKEVFSGVLMETSEGNRIGICMRDDTFEINVLPKGEDTQNWWRVNMQTGRIYNQREACKQMADACIETDNRRIPKDV